MNEIVLTTGVVVFVVYAVFHIAYLVEMRRTSAALRRFIAKTDDNIQPALSALRNIFEDIGKATENVAVLTERARDLTERMAAVERTVSDLYGQYKDAAGEAARAQAAGLKAGVRAGMASLLKTLNTRKESSS